MRGVAGVALMPERADLAFAAFALLILLPCGVSASCPSVSLATCDVCLVEPGSGSTVDWHAAGSWEPAQQPNATSHVCIARELGVGAVSVLEPSVTAQANVSTLRIGSVGAEPFASEREARVVIASAGVLTLHAGASGVSEIVGNTSMIDVRTSTWQETLAAASGSVHTLRLRDGGVLRLGQGSCVSGPLAIDVSGAGSAVEMVRVIGADFSVIESPDPAGVWTIADGAALRVFSSTTCVCDETSILVTNATLEVRADTIDSEFGLATRCHQRATGLAQVRLRNGASGFFYAAPDVVMDIHTGLDAAAGPGGERVRVVYTGDVTLANYPGVTDAHRDWVSSDTDHVFDAAGVVAPIQRVAFSSSDTVALLDESVVDFTQVANLSLGDATISLDASSLLSMSFALPAAVSARYDIAGTVSVTTASTCVDCVIRLRAGATWESASTGRWDNAQVRVDGAALISGSGGGSSLLADACDVSLNASLRFSSFSAVSFTNSLLTVHVADGVATLLDATGLSLDLSGTQLRVHWDFDEAAMPRYSYYDRSYTLARFASLTYASEPQHNLTLGEFLPRNGTCDPYLDAQADRLVLVLPGVSTCRQAVCSACVGADACSLYPCDEQNHACFAPVADAVSCRVDSTPTDHVCTAAAGCSVLDDPSGDTNPPKPSNAELTVVIVVVAICASVGVIAALLVVQASRYRQIVSEAGKQE